MKNLLSKVYSNEMRRFLFAIVIGWLITTVFYYGVNSALDAQLESKFDSKAEAFAKLNYYQSAQKKALDFDDYERILDETTQSKLGDIENYKALFLYGEPTFDPSIGWSDYGSLLFPYMNKTTFSGGSIIEFLMSYDTELGSYKDRKFQILSAYDAKRKSVRETSEDRKDLNENAKGFREEVQKDLSYAMEPILNSIQNSGAYKVRRYLNGFIQYLTIWLTFTGIFIIVVFHLFPAIKARSGLVKVLSSTSENSMQTITGQYLEGSTYTTLLPFKLFGLLKDFFGTKEQKGVDHAKMELKNNIEEIRIEQESSGGMMRYLIWVIPSIGFIGTVSGIAQALENSHTVISDGGQLERQAAVQDITSYLAVAFDTTLIALFASILLYLLVQVTFRYEESFIAESLAKISTKLAGVEFTMSTSNDQNWKVVLSVIKKQLTTEEQQSPEVKEFITYCEKRLKG